MRLLFLLLVLFTLTACGTLVHGTKQDVACISSPAGAKVTTSDGTSCMTPCTIRLKRAKDEFLTIEREGYEPMVFAVHSTLTKASAGEVLLPGGLVCWGIDLASGAAFRLSPERVDVNLQPETDDKEPQGTPSQ